MEKLPLSLVIITLNEEKNIERCIKSVPFASEVIVVDTYSKDKTVELAKALSAKVFQKDWSGYGAQKAYATSLASNEWILSLDADEALSPELARELYSQFNTLNPKIGYQFPRKSYHMGRWISYGGWYPDYQLRLFNKNNFQWNVDLVHEKVEVQTKVTFQSPILHWVFEDISDQVITNDKYSGLGADKLYRENKKFSMFKLLVKPLSKFLECYFLKRGLLDGLPGFIIAVSAAYSVFLKFAKLWELETLKKNQKDTI